jgi:hypothetical protein
MSSRWTRVLSGRALGGLLALALGGCPIPQPLPEVVSVSGGTIPPPRIVVESVVPPDAIILVSQTCDSVEFSLTATVIDENTEEQVEARWFMDYDASVSPNRDPLLTTSLPPPTPDSAVRPVPEYRFSPSLADSWTVHVIELVISNGFYSPGGEPADKLPNRTAQPGFETQVYRWVFQSVSTGGRCH